jgi:Arm DNA-binding domain
MEGSHGADSGEDPASIQRPSNALGRGRPSLALRTTTNGAKSWVVVTRLRGRVIFCTLGRHPGISLLAARELARQTLEMVARGEDPRERRRADKIRAELGTFGAVAAEFLEKGATGKPSYGETKRIIEKELIPVWGLAPIEQSDAVTSSASSI